jgi:mono/diheme cytochrome c family protein
MKQHILLSLIAVTVLTGGASITASAADAPLYTVVDGTKVDADTLTGFKTWRAAACDRCHGPNQEGMVGPSLVESLKTLTKDEFKATVTNGRLEKGMPSFSTNAKVVDNLDKLYAYLKGRSDGKITAAKVTGIE